MSVKAAPLMISSALKGPSGCLQYDEGTTKLLGQYLTSMKICDMQDSNSTSYIQYFKGTQQRRSWAWPVW